MIANDYMTTAHFFTAPNWPQPLRIGPSHLVCHLGPPRRIALWRENFHQIARFSVDPIG